MQKKINITHISATFKNHIGATNQKHLSLSFEIADHVDKTQPIQNNGEQIIWTKTFILQFKDDNSLLIKANDHNDTTNASIATATLSLKTLTNSGKHSVQLITSNKESIGSVTFNYITTESVLQTKQSPVKSKLQASTKKLESPSKLQQSQNKKQSTEHIKEPTEKKKQHLQSISQSIIQKPVFSKKLIEDNHEELSNQKKEQPKPTDVKLSDRIPRKLTQKSLKKPSEKTIQNQKPQQINLDITNQHQISIIDSKSLNKSQNTFKLPNIGDVSKNFGDRIFDKQSSATLQKSILVFSMPKAQRFGSGPKYAGEPSYYVDSCFKPNSTKGVGFGFGNKRQFPEWMQKNMKENPAPGSYFQEGKVSAHIRSRGPTFGISHKFYEKVTIPKQKSPQKSTISNQRLKPILRTN